MGIASINPATGKVIRTYDELSVRDVDGKLQQAVSAFRQHKHSAWAERSRRMQQAAQILESEAETWGQLMVQEMGKPKKAAVSEALKCASVCRHYAEQAQSYLADQPLPGNGGQSYVRHLPIGAVLAIMPWNFPFWQVFRFAAPALMAGNVGLLKHASNVPQCALAIEEILRRAGFAPGVFQTLLLGSERVPEVIADPRVAAVTLTGSEGAGSQVASAAGKNLKKTVLELGGSDPFIVMPSADLKHAVKTAVAARTINNGQSCIAAKRFIVHREVYDSFEKQFVDGLQRLKVGDPMREDTDVGPLATPSILETLESQVKDAIAQGARLLTGGKRLEGPGNYYAPSVLANITRKARVYREEVFGPVACLFRVGSVDEAIELANDSTYGLASSVWTREEPEAQRLINELEAGLTFVNAMVASDPRMPFGGVKHSGYGRELGAQGIREFVNIKTVHAEKTTSEIKTTE